MLADARAEQALIAALEDDSSEVRVAAAETLGRIGTPLAVVPLREASPRGPSCPALGRCLVPLTGRRSEANRDCARSLAATWEFRPWRGAVAAGKAEARLPRRPSDLGCAAG